MHELSLAQALVGEVERIKVREKASRVLSVTVAVGALSGVDCESLAFIFPVVAEGTGLEGAALVLQETPALVHCEDCGRESRPDLAFFKCGECGSARVRITGGREFLIRSVQVESEDDTQDGAGAARPGTGERHDV